MPFSTSRSAKVVGTWILASVSMLLFRVHGAQSLTQSSENPARPLPAYLVMLGYEYDRFFTIEEAWESDNPKSIQNHWLQRPAETGLQQELDRMVEIVPDFAYAIDQTNPRIIHVMDKRLAQQKGYALEAVTGHIDFKGKVKDLPAELHKQGIPISYPDYISLGGGETKDFTTVVHVTGEGLKVRDALSNFIPLDGRKGKILWVARTQLGQGQDTSVNFP